MHFLFASMLLSTGTGMQLRHGVRSGVNVLPDNPAIRYVGRSAPASGGLSSGMRFDVNGFEIRFRVEGASEVRAKLAQETTEGWYNFSAQIKQERYCTHPPVRAPPIEVCPGSSFHEFLVIIDGKAQTVNNNGGLCKSCTFDTAAWNGTLADTYLVASGLSAGSHDIRIFKSTEPDFNCNIPVPNYMTFHGLVLDAGHLLETSESPPQRRLEFLGDSTATGFCNMCSSAEDQCPRQASLVYSWTNYICDIFGAECHHLAQAGLCLSRRKKEGNLILPDLWPRALVTDASAQWDFSSWVPQGLVISVGSNDLQSVTYENGRTDLTVPPKFISTYVDLVTSAINKYGPSLHVFLSCLHFEKYICPAAAEVVERINAAGGHAHLLNTTGLPQIGCCQHPDKEDAKVIANQAVTAMESALSWSRVASV